MSLFGSAPSMMGSAVSPSASSHGPARPGADPPPAAASDSASSDPQSRSSEEVRDKGQVQQTQPGIGSFDRLSWRMLPPESYSDWTIQVVRQSHDQTTVSATATTTTTVTAVAGSNTADDGNGNQQQEETDINHHSNREAICSIDTYHVHRSVLAVGPRHSEYFAAQFQLSMQENQSQTSRIALESDCADVFPTLLDFVYSTENPFPCTLTPHTATALYSLAQYLDIPRLRQMVHSYYKKHVSMARISQFLDCAYHHRAIPLLQVAMDTCVHYLLQLQPSTAKHMHPHILWKMLQINVGLTNRIADDDDHDHHDRYDTNGSESRGAEELPNLTEESAAADVPVRKDSMRPLRRTFSWHTSQLVAACGREQHRRLVKSMSEGVLDATLNFPHQQTDAKTSDIAIPQNSASSAPSPTNLHESSSAHDGAECTELHTDTETWNREIFDRLTHVSLLPYLEPSSAVYLLSLDAALRNMDDDGSSSGMNNPGQPYPAPPITCLQRRCIQAINSEWKTLRKSGQSCASFAHAMNTIPSHVLLEVLFYSTNDANIEVLRCISKTASVSSKANATTTIYKHQVESKFEPPPRCLVQNAGWSQVNSVYLRDGLYQGVPMYTSILPPRSDESMDHGGVICIFQCFVGKVQRGDDDSLPGISSNTVTATGNNSTSRNFGAGWAYPDLRGGLAAADGNRTRRWFMSVIPRDGHAGSGRNIDLYSAAVSNHCVVFPPRAGWTAVREKMDPVPTVLF